MLLISAIEPQDRGTEAGAEAAVYIASTPRKQTEQEVRTCSKASGPTPRTHFL